MKNRAFTLIELLVVVLIIGILAAIAVPKYQLAVEKSRAREGLLTMFTLIQAWENFYLANGYYTDDKNDLDISLPQNINFRYKLSPNYGIIATPYPNPYRYMLGYRHNKARTELNMDKIVCGVGNADNPTDEEIAKAKDICKSIGADINKQRGYRWVIAEN